MRILHITDIHMEVPPERLNPGIGQVLDGAAELIHGEAPDFLFVTGDLTSHGSSEMDELVHARAWLDSLGVPYLAVAGNHDLGANAWRGERYPDAERYDPHPFADTNFGRTFDSRPVVVRDLGPIWAVGASVRAGDPDEVLPRLATVLADAKKPVVLLGHYPLAPTRSDGVLSRFGAGDFIPDLVDPLTKLIRSHAAVKLYAAGHVHAVSARPLTAGCLQITAGGLGPGASAYRRYDVSASHLTYSTHLGPGPLGFWERYAPLEAPFPVDYHLGAPSERMGTVSLR
jgi:Icc protein